MGRSPEMSPEQAQAIKRIEALKAQLEKTTEPNEQQQIVAEINELAKGAGLI